jgi:L-2-hydroxyglutarate oxidase LhgO
MDRFGVAVIGAGLVGLAVAYRLTKRFPDRRVIVLERDGGIARNQTAHGSCVIHCGVHDTPGSARLGLCRTGRSALLEFCEAHRIPHRVGGALVVATNAREADLLDALHRRGRANGVDCRMIAGSEIEGIEPQARGAAAVHVRDTGVVDYRLIAERLASRIAARGGVIRTGCEVIGSAAGGDGVVVRTTTQEVLAQGVISCAGVHADRVARACGVDPGVMLVPFRSDVYRLRVEAEQRVRSIIDRVPNPDRPFLGPHIARRADGGLEVGPNARLAWSRAGRGFDGREAIGRAVSPAFLGLSARLSRKRTGEAWRADGTKGFGAALRAVVPSLGAIDLADRRRGVRAIALQRDGSIVDDFLMVDGRRSVHVIAVPASGATAALALADAAIDRLGRVLE